MPDDPKDVFTPEQSEKLNAIMGATVNNILTARLATETKKIVTQVNGSVAEALKAQLPELLKELHPAPVDPKDGKGKGGKGEDAVEMATLRKQVQDLQKSNETERTARMAAEARRRETDRQRILLGDLAKLGVTDPFKQELAVAYLDRNKRVTWSGDEEDAALLWNAPEGPVSYNEGIASWAKGEEIKHFLPATGMRGAGSRPTQGSLPNGQKPNDEQRWEMVGQAFKEAWDRGV